MELNIVVVRNLGDLANANVYAYKFRVQLSKSPKTSCAIKAPQRVGVRVGCFRYSNKESSQVLIHL